MHSTFFVDAQWIFDTGPVISAFFAERHYNNQKAEGSTKAFASEALTSCQVYMKIWLWILTSAEDTDQVIGSWLLLSWSAAITSCHP